MMTTKTELLAKYATRVPRAFRQYDGFLVAPDAADGIMAPDADGDCVFGGMTTLELMHGANVRVLLTPETTPEQAARLLGKIIDGIQRDAEQAAEQREVAKALADGAQYLKSIDVKLSAKDEGQSSAKLQAAREAIGSATRTLTEMLTNLTTPF